VSSQLFQSIPRIATISTDFHLKMRREKLRLFFSLVGDAHGESLLDVGGAAGYGGEFEEFSRRFGFTCSLNLTVSWLKGTTGHAVIGDGCQMPFRTGSFDWVFSNAVIEHVGDWEQQQQFAAEIRRVARKGYFVSTPNRHFPVDPHSLLPFFQYLSPRYQKRACRFALQSYMRREPQAVGLLSARRLRVLFPGARVLGAGLPVVKNNLVAMFRSVQ
jgi:hypothetical protein